MTNIITYKEFENLDIRVVQSYQLKKIISLKNHLLF